MNPGAVVELPLDENLLKVLSSESRREILRLLAERRMTGAELATRLNLGKPAVAEHLQKLQQANLISRADDPERRWVYYDLTSQGRDILEPKRVRFYLVLGVAVLALLAGIALALGYVTLMGGSIGSSPINDAGTDMAGVDGGLDGLAGTQSGSALPGDETPVGASVPGDESTQLLAVPIENRTVVWYVPDEDGDSSSPTVLRLVVGEGADPVPTPASSATGTPAIGLTGAAALVSATNATPAVGTVYVFSPSDVDLLNGTVTVHASNATISDAASSSDVVALSLPGTGLVPVTTGSVNATSAVSDANATAPAAASADAQTTNSGSGTTALDQGTPNNISTTASAPATATQAATAPASSSPVSSNATSSPAPSTPPGTDQTASGASTTATQTSAPATVDRVGASEVTLNGENTEPLANGSDAFASSFSSTSLQNPVQFQGVAGGDADGNVVASEPTVKDRTPGEAIPLAVLVVGALVLVAVRARKA